MDNRATMKIALLGWASNVADCSWQHTKNKYLILISDISISLPQSHGNANAIAYLYLFISWAE